MFKYLDEEAEEFVLQWINERKSTVYSFVSTFMEITR